MKPFPDPHYRHRFPAEVISHAVWLYHVFNLSLRDIELLLAERGIAVSHETMRRWCQKFGALRCPGHGCRTCPPIGEGGKIAVQLKAIWMSMTGPPSCCFPWEAIAALREPKPEAVGPRARRQLR